MQSAPLLVFSKIIGSVFNCNKYGLYLLTFICGILTLIADFKIAKILFGDNSFGILVFVVLMCGSLALLYCTTEFKQYGIEAFVGFLLFFIS